MGVMTEAFYKMELRKGMKLRNHPHPVLRDRNRKRVRYAIAQLHYFKRCRERERG